MAHLRPESKGVRHKRSSLRNSASQSPFDSGSERTSPLLPTRDRSARSSTRSVSTIDTVTNDSTALQEPDLQRQLPPLPPVPPAFRSKRKTSSPSVRTRSSRRNSPAVAQSPLTSYVDKLNADDPPNVRIDQLLSSLSSLTHEEHVDKVKLVVAIDFGTTYSGVAYAVVQPNENPEDVAVFTVRDWAGKLPGRTITNKVPTVIAFDGLDDGCPKGEGNVHWGYDIPQHLDDQTIRFVKLLLEPDVSRRISSLNDVIDPEATRGRLELLGKVAVPVAAEYVKCLWQHAKDRIIQHVGQATFDFANKVILFTVPAVWSEKAKHNTYMIAVDAGLADHEYTLRMISEPEAAAVAVLTDRVKSLSLQEGDVYLVVDAGGGTVDLTSYRLKTKEPKLNLEEVAAGDGDVCGAVFLEMNFRKLLRTYLGTDVLDNLEQEHRDWIICAWEDSIRALFTGTDDRKYTLVTPGVPNDASVKIKGGMMTLNAAEILPIFSPVIDKIERLVRRQIKALQEKGFRPKAILLVGGLGCNKFLAKQLRSRYSSPEQIDAQCAIEVRQLDVAWESVAHGAVRCELFGCSNMVSLRIARYNVGYSYAASWQEGLYLPEQKIPDEYRGGFTANKVINWVLRRNEPMKDRATHEFSMEGLAWEDQLQAIAAAPSIEKIFWFGQSLIASPEDDAPVYPTTKTRAFATVRVPWDLAQIPFDKVPRRISPTGKPYRAIRYDVSMEQNMSGMIFRYKLQGRSVGKSVNVDFHSLPEDVDEATAYSIQ